MVELFPTRRRAEEFARALEGEQQTVDDRLQRLLDTASTLAAVPVVSPRPEFRDSLRTRLLEAAADELPAQATSPAAAADGDHTGRARNGAAVVYSPHADRRRRRLVAVATGLVLVGGGTGVAAASEQALPGDMLYPVKRTLESAKVTWAQGADDVGRALLDRAAVRLDEAEALGGSSPSDTDLEGVEAALDDFALDASLGGENLLDAYATSGDPDDLQALRDFTAESHQALGELAEVLPPEAQPAVTAADETVVALDGRATKACPDCTSTAPLLSLPTDPVALPDLAPNASPDVPGRDPLTLPGLSRPETQRADDDQRKGEGQRANHSPPQRTAGADDTTPALPDVGLRGPQPQQQTEQDAAPGPGGGDQAQRRLDLGLGGLLDGPAPQPSHPSRSTGGPDLGDLGEVTEPLRPRFDGTRKTGRGHAGLARRHDLTR